MADPFPPSEARERRVGVWVSGAVHAAALAALTVSGALFRAPESPSIRMAPAQTMTEAQFQDMAAASRGAGPVDESLSATPAQPRPPSDEVVAGGPEALSPPVREADPTAMPQPDVAGEAAPSLSDLQVPQVPVAVATVAPVPQEPSPAATADVGRVATLTAPPRAAPAGGLADPAPTTPPPAPPAPPQPALTTSDAPFQVAAARQRQAERAAEAAARAAAERAAAEQAAAEAERQRIAAEAAAREQAERAAARARAEEAARAEAEAQAQAEAERQAALAEARRQAEAEAEAAREAEAEAARQAEAEAEAERQAQAERRRAAEEAAAAAAAAAALAEAQQAERARAEALAREQAEAPREAPDEPDALTRALEQALAQAPEGAGATGGGGRAAAGPPLSEGERDGLRLQIYDCWNIGSMSREAQRVSVSVQFEMTRDGLPIEDSVELIGHDGGSDAAAAQAFQFARRAILRCALQKGGYQLPPEKYARWRRTIVDFRPQGGPTIR